MQLFQESEDAVVTIVIFFFLLASFLEQPIQTYPAEHLFVKRVPHEGSCRLGQQFLLAFTLVKTACPAATDI